MPALLGRVFTWIGIGTVASGAGAAKEALDPTKLILILVGAVVVIKIIK